MTQHVPIVEADEHNFAQVVVEGSKERPVLVDFSAEWCAPCRAIEPVMHKIADEMVDRLTVVKVDADENMKLCGHYRLRGFPTVLLFQNGEEKGRFAGFRPTHQVKDFIEEHLD